MQYRNEKFTINTNIRAQIDQRLRMIKNDEEMPGVAKLDDETPEEQETGATANTDTEQS